MLRNLIIAFVCIGMNLIAISQTPIDIAENTLKIAPNSEEVFYYGFAEGDQLIFNFEEINGKELKELEIMFLPSKSIFMDYKSKKIENKTLIIAETGIYKFKFVNSNILAGRICKFKIQRIPADEKTKKFNTTVFKRTVFDTTYYNIDERVLVKSDTLATELVNQVVKVHSTTNPHGNKTETNFYLPDNTISWSYYIGVDQAGQHAYESAASKLKSIPNTIVPKLINGNPLAALALDFTSYLPLLQKGEDIDYVLLDGDNLQFYRNRQAYRYIKSGKVINDFARMIPDKRNLFFCFSNDNAVTGVTVNVRVVAIQVNRMYEIRPTKKMSLTSRQEMYLKN